MRIYTGMPAPPHPGPAAPCKQQHSFWLSFWLLCRLQHVWQRRVGRFSALQSSLWLQQLLLLLLLLIACFRLEGGRSAAAAAQVPDQAH